MWKEFPHKKVATYTDDAQCTLIKMEREIFFLGNLFPKYEELVPYYEVNYFFPFFRENLPSCKIILRYEERIP